MSIINTDPASTLQYHSAIVGGAPIAVGATNETAWIDTQGFSHAVLLVKSTAAGAAWTSADIAIYHNDSASDTGESVAGDATSTVTVQAFVRAGTCTLSDKKRYIKGSFRGNAIGVTVVEILLFGGVNTNAPTDTPIHIEGSSAIAYDFTA